MLSPLWPGFASQSCLHARAVMEKKDGETLDYRVNTCLKFKDFLTGSGAGESGGGTAHTSGQVSETPLGTALPSSVTRTPAGHSGAHIEWEPGESASHL